MKAMILRQIAQIEQKPLQMAELDMPEPSLNELLVQVKACGICHTDIDEIEGRLPIPKLPIVLGHQVVACVVEKGSDVTNFNIGDRIGVTWLYSACGKCSFCKTNKENLCDNARWTGKDVNGGYAEYMTVGADFAHPIPESFSDTQAAPLLCAGVIGYRALRLTELKNGQTLGLFGFGSSAHIVIQITKFKYPGTKVFVFTRSRLHQQLAEKLGADWTGLVSDKPPVAIDKAIDFTPIGQTVKDALAVTNKGGSVIINAIRKTTPIPQLEYAEYLWHEKQIKSVANVTRKDAEEFLPLAERIPIVPEVEEFQLDQANEALINLKQATLRAAAVLRIQS